MSDLKSLPDKLRTAITVFVVLTLMVWVPEKPRPFGTELSSHTCPEQLGDVLGDGRAVTGQAAHQVSSS